MSSASTSDKPTDHRPPAPGSGGRWFIDALLAQRQLGDSLIEEEKNVTVNPEHPVTDNPTTDDSTTEAPAPGDPSSLEDLDDGHAPDESSADLVDSLEEKVLHEEDSPVLDVEQDADAHAVRRDPQHSGDEAQPPT